MNNLSFRRDTTLTEEQTELITRTIVVCHDLGDEISLALPSVSALMSSTLNNQTRALDSTAFGAASSKRRQIQVGYAFLFDSVTEMATKRRYPKPWYVPVSFLLISERIIFQLPNLVEARRSLASSFVCGRVRLSDLWTGEFVDTAQAVD